jgi:hypothetical protein
VIRPARQILVSIALAPLVASIASPAPAADAESASGPPDTTFKVVVLDPVDGPPASGSSINNRGQVAGFSRTSDGSISRHNLARRQGNGSRHPWRGQVLTARCCGQ